MRNKPIGSRRAVFGRRVASTPALAGSAVAASPSEVMDWSEPPRAFTLHGAQWKNAGTAAVLLLASVLAVLGYVGRGATAIPGANIVLALAIGCFGCFKLGLALFPPTLTITRHGLALKGHLRDEHWAWADIERVSVQARHRGLSFYVALHLRGARTESSLPSNWTLGPVDLMGLLESARYAARHDRAEAFWDEVDAAVAETTEDPLAPLKHMLMLLAALAAIAVAAEWLSGRFGA